MKRFFSMIPKQTIQMRSLPELHNHFEYKRKTYAISSCIYSLSGSIVGSLGVVSNNLPITLLGISGIAYSAMSEYKELKYDLEKCRIEEHFSLNESK